MEEPDDNLKITKFSIQSTIESNLPDTEPKPNACYESSKESITNTPDKLLENDVKSIFKTDKQDPIINYDSNNSTNLGQPDQKINENNECNALQTQPAVTFDEICTNQINMDQDPVEKVMIKEEYFDEPDSQLVFNSEQVSLEIQKLLDIKAEAIEVPVVHKPKRKKKKTDDEKDETYTPDSYKNEERQFDPNLSHSFDTLRNIELVTITEEQRIQELELSNLKRKQYQYKCEHCALGFVIKKAYDKHMIMHSPLKGQFKCDICSIYLSNPRLHYQHRLRHYRRYRCSLCSEATLYKEKEAVACHIRLDHEKEAFRCDQCDKVFRRPTYLKIHIEQHHIKENEHKCPVCEKVFYTRSWFRTHVRTHEEEVKTKSNQSEGFICDICSTRVKSKNDMLRHIRALHGPHEEVPCHICMRIYKNKTVLSRHITRDHVNKKNEEKQLCPICQKYMTNRALLRHHMRRMHSDTNKQYQCDYCKRFFRTRGEVRSHIEWTHMRNALSWHICAICTKQLRTPALLRNHHERHHSGITPPRDKICPKCNKAFACKQTLARHIKSHEGIKYPCLECGEEFKTPEYIRVHHQRKHQNMTRKEISELKLKRKQQRMGFVPEVLNVECELKVMNEECEVKNDESA